MTSGQYVNEKIFIGFVFGCLSAVIATALCFRLNFAGAVVMLALIVLSATFEGIMDLANGGMATAGRDIATLVVHCAVWFLIYLLISRRQAVD